MPLPAKRRLPPATVCRIALVLMLALLVLALFHAQQGLPGVPYVREQAHNVRSEREQPGQMEHVAGMDNGSDDAKRAAKGAHRSEAQQDDTDAMRSDVLQVPEHEHAQMEPADPHVRGGQDQTKPDRPEQNDRHNDNDNARVDAEKSDKQDQIQAENQQSNSEEVHSPPTDQDEPTVGGQQPDSREEQNFEQEEKHLNGQPQLQHDGTEIQDGDSEQQDDDPESPAADNDNLSSVNGENPPRPWQDKPRNNASEPQNLSAPSLPPSQPEEDPLLPPTHPNGKKGVKGDGTKTEGEKVSQRGDNNTNTNDTPNSKGRGREANEEPVGKGGQTSGVKLTDEPCLKYIVYDKPVKTGSSAVTAAIRSYLETRGETADKCTKDECTEMAQAICDGRHKPRALLGHMFGEDGLLECLRKRGYYVVTSVREPMARWESAYLFNKKKQGRHYGIAYREGYKFFMEHFPACALYQYYDNTDAKCKGPSTVEERLQPIVARYDEIIDLHEGGRPRGQLHGIIAKYIGEVNKSLRPDQKFREAFDRSRLDNETKLYRALKRQREEILKTGQPPLC